MKTQVYLVGAGPGDAGLITVKGLRCLQQADVVLYDKLANPQFLQEAPEGAELIYVGKDKGHHILPQEQINRLLEEKARPGRIVVRLKGGDPFIFGRGGEEAQHLERAGIPFEVVPGITAGFAAAAYAGIPVTHRDCTTSVSLITGHSKPGRQEPDLNWQALASGNGTLLFYMGLSNLAMICERLMTHGRAAETPVAIICHATTARQKTLVTTLAEASRQVAEHNIAPPAVIVVGKVVSLRDQLRWFDGLRPVEPAPLLSQPEEQDRGRAVSETPPGDEATPGPDDGSEVSKSLPVLLNNPRILLLGGGRVAYRKARVLLDNHVEFKVLAQAYLPEFQDFSDRLELTTKQAQAADLEPFNIIVDATGNQEVADLVQAEKRRRYLLCNSVADSQRSDFHFSSLLNYGLLKIAVSTGGASPTVGRIVREKIQATLPGDLNQLLQDKALERKAGSIDSPLTRQQTLAAFAQLYLIGSGPEKLGFLSRKGRQYLEQMDVVIYDRQLPQQFLELIPKRVRALRLEDQQRHAALDQEAVNRIVLGYLQQGLQVALVRADAPDFTGRDFELIQFLARQEIEMKLVPGPH
jgi:uroporphyrin-III C-methyltransferase